MNWWRAAASLWCARWFWPGSDGRPPSPAETRALVDRLVTGRNSLPGAHAERRLMTAARVAGERRFFHWSLEFPDVFYGPEGRPQGRGFDAVIGNPPWEMLRRDPAGGQDPRRPLLRFVRESGVYSACDRGHLNLYQPFLERSLSLARSGGRVGLVLPWGLAVDDGAAPLRRLLFDHTALDTFIGLDNRRGLFPIHRGLRFAVVVAVPGRTTREARARFGVSTADELDGLPASGEPLPDRLAPYPIRIAPARIRAVGGSAMRVPDARDPQDIAFLERVAREAPRFGEPSSWHGRFGRELNATDARPDLGVRGLMVVEGKHLTPFAVTTSTGRRIARHAALRRLPDARFDHARLGYRDVSGVGNAQAIIAAIVPAGCVTTHTVFCLRTPQPIERHHFLCAVFNSLVVNGVARLLMGGHVTTSLAEDLPIPVWRGAAADRTIALLAGELCRRPRDTALRATLEGLVARRYRLDRETFQWLIERFPPAEPDLAGRAVEAFTRSVAAG